MKVTVELEGQDRPRTHEVLADRVEDEVELIVDGHEMEATVEAGEDELLVHVDGETHRVAFEDEEGQVRVDGQRLGFELTDFVAGQGPGETDHLVAPEGRVQPPMPGEIVAVHVERGDEVQAGDVLATLEAMKMQNDIEAPRDGVVLNMDAEVGQTVEGHEVLFEVGDPEDLEDVEA